MAAKKGGSQWPEWMKPGLRVVRAPDWKTTVIKDPNAALLGTLSYVPKLAADNKVNVVLDTGIERSFKSGFSGQYDLRAYDMQQVGVEHKNSTCSECSSSPLRGIRYHCPACSVDVCTKCYHLLDKHALNHAFLRYDTPSSEQVNLAPRKNTHTKMKLMGLFEKSEVIRGPHWNYPNKDGGDTNKGTVMAFIPLKDGVANAHVRIKWEIGSEVEEYRFGVGGHVDVVAFKATCGGSIYLDHLPLVGIVKLKTSDKVTVNMDLKEFKEAQTKANVHGGWKDEMGQCLKEVGTILELLFNGDMARVQYEDGNTHIVCKSALFRKNGFSTGGAADIIKDKSKLKKLQEGHGGYSSDMLKACGKIGRIVKIQKDGDILIFVENKKFTLNPTCCTPIEEKKLAQKAPRLPDEESDGEDEGDCVPGRKLEEITMDKTPFKDKRQLEDFNQNMNSLMGSMMSLPAGETAGLGELMFNAFTQADLNLVKDLIKNNISLISYKHEGRSILHLACHEGYRDLVNFLIESGANIDDQDDEGDTPLHYAAFGKQADCVQTMLENAADANAQNKNGITPLIIAVNHPCIDSVQYLIVNNANVSLLNVDGDTAMHDAVEQTESQPLISTAVLSSRSADFSIKNSSGFNVLQWASIKDNKGAVKLILEKGSGIVNDRLKEEGFTALHIAAANDFVEITSLLLDLGSADPDSRDLEDRTPLHIAVAQAQKRIIEVLVQKNADVNAQDKEGDTPLHYSQKKEPLTVTRSTRKTKSGDGQVNIQITYFLLEKGADIYKKNKEGCTPMDLVIDPTIKTMLEKLTASYKAAPAKSQKGVRLPINWSPMNITEVDVVPLDQTCSIQKQEYDEVAKHFSKTMEFGVIRYIKRVQNPLLWEHYTLKKREMESKMGQGCANELHLYHGTKPELVDIIAQDNFDFRIAGSRVGALYGDGSYFATTAKYSDLYASSDQSGHKIMFVAKVLTGKSCLGQPGLKRPPEVDPDDYKKGMYHSTVNNIMNPTIYCVFDKNQYYPEYLIEYR